MKKFFSVVAAVIVVALLWQFYDTTMGSNRVPTITIDKTNAYKLLIDNKRFIIKGVCYAPIPVGKDYEYNFWGDKAKPWITDGRMMKEAGINTIRIYRAGKNPEEVKRVVGDLYKKYRIRTLMGNYLGFWNWPPPNYTDADFRNKVRDEVLEMVRLYKNEPGILAWVLGNENNYSFDQNLQRWSNDEIDALPDREAQRKAKAKIYYSYVNSLAQEIKKIDPKHLVVMGVGEVASLEIAKENCPDIDALGMIAYRGPTFGNLFRQVKQKFDIPVIMTEWGADSYNAYRRESDEQAQADFLKLQWQDIERNTSTQKGVGNALGGTLFEWTDEWWKANENLPYTWATQDTSGQWLNASYHYDAQSAPEPNINEEWFGIVALDPKERVNGNLKRIPKEGYQVLKTLWKGKSDS